MLPVHLAYYDKNVQKRSVEVCRMDEHYSANRDIGAHVSHMNKGDLEHVGRSAAAAVPTTQELVAIARIAPQVAAAGTVHEGITRMVEALWTTLAVPCAVLRRSAESWTVEASAPAGVPWTDDRAKDTVIAF